MRQRGEGVPRFWDEEEKEKEEDEEREEEEEEEEWLVGRCRPVEAWPAANWPCNALMLPDPGCPPALHCSYTGLHCTALHGAVVLHRAVLFKYVVNS